MCSICKQEILRFRYIVLEASMVVVNSGIMGLIPGFFSLMDEALSQGLVSI